MSVTAPGREVSCFIASLGSLRLLALGPAVFSCTTLPSRGPTLFPLLSLLPPTHPQPRTCPGRGETNAGLGFCRGPRTPGSLKHKPWGSHGSELPLREVCLPTCHPCLPSCLPPPLLHLLPFFCFLHFSHSVMSDSSRPHEPSPTPRAYPNSCPLSQ